MSASAPIHAPAHSLALASLGWDVLATDIAPVVNTVLKPNVARNVRMLRESEPPTEPGGRTRCGNVQVRELDWSALPTSWCWTDSCGVAVADHGDGNGPFGGTSGEHDDEELLAPPFDLIVTSDTVYSTNLVAPLLRTLHQLCQLSQPGYDVERHQKKLRPLMYVAVENRDPGLLDSFFKQARDDWGFTTMRVPDRHVQRAMERKRLGWNREDWDGVEVWKFQLQEGVA